MLRVLARSCLAFTKAPMTSLNCYAPLLINTKLTTGLNFAFTTKDEKGEKTEKTDKPKDKPVK